MCDHHPDVLQLALGMPKAELHIHIEGSLEPELAFALARRNGVTLPYPDEAALKAAYNFDSLQSFLDLYYACASVLLKKDDFRDLMVAYLEKSASCGVVYAEIFFDPQTHTDRGVPMSVVMEGLIEGLKVSKERWGISGQLIMCFLRHLSEEECLKALKEAEPYLENILGFGLDSSEKGHPPSKFVNLFSQCHKHGKYVVAHAGEEGPAAYITEALDLIGAVRIDHGVRAIEDPELVQRLAKQGTALTVCPLSNVRLCVFKDMKQHTLPQLLKAGVKVMINSDDPAYFGGYMDQNIKALHEAFEFDAQTWYQLARNSFEGTLASQAQKDEWIARLNVHFDQSGFKVAH